MAHLKEGDQLSVTIHEGGTISFTPIKDRTVDDKNFDNTLDEVLNEYSDTLTKLS
jgi:antitoxin component of MazEF toxin-antitoxin module